MVNFLLLLSPEFCLDIFHRPPVLLLLGADHPVLSIGLCLLGRVQRGVQAYQVLVLGMVICLRRNLQIQKM